MCILNSLNIFELLLNQTIQDISNLFVSSKVQIKYQFIKSSWHHFTIVWFKNKRAYDLHIFLQRRFSIDLVE